MLAVGACRYYTGKRAHSVRTVPKVIHTQHLSVSMLSRVSSFHAFTLTRLVIIILTSFSFRVPRSFRLPSPTVLFSALKMGVSWSSVSECLGDFSDHHSSRYNRVPPSRRVEQSAISSSRDRTALRQRCVSEDKLTISAASPGAAIAPPPPPLVPDSNAVYNLLEDEDEDVCPTCLETYASDNPKIVSTCGHAFHLQCIVAWETRSGSRFCPICAKVMEYVEADQPSRSKSATRT